jgi:ubiquinone/menaquinone biosynthesis C-methylase UbiE
MMGTLPTIDRERMQQMYQDRWRAHGVSPQSLGWTKGKQDARFRVLLADLDCEGKSVLDVGCGFGDLNRVLREKCRQYVYHGLDLVPEFVNQGTGQYGGNHVTFQVGDFLELALPSESFDYVVAAGAFSYQLQEMDNYTYLERALTEMFRVCREAVSVDFLSDRVNYRKAHCFHSKPEIVLTLALQLTRNIRLRHDYMPFEFATTLFKDDSFDEHDTLFRRHKHEVTNH